MAEKITVKCTSCAATLSVPASAAGKKIRCPKCSAVMSIRAKPASQPIALEYALDDGAESDDKSPNVDDLDWPMEDNEEADWATNSYSEIEPVQPVGKDRNKKRSDDSKTRDKSTQKAKRSKATTNSSTQTQPPVSTTNASGGLSKLVIRLCVFLIVISVGTGGFLIYRNESTRKSRIADELLVNAQKRLSEGKPTEAEPLLKEYMSSKRGNNNSVAEDLLRQIAAATSETDISATLLAMDDDEFGRVQVSSIIDDGQVTEPSICDLRKQTVAKLLPKIVDARLLAAEVEASKPEPEKLGEFDIPDSATMAFPKLVESIKTEFSADSMSRASATGSLFAIRPGREWPSVAKIPSFEKKTEKKVASSGQTLTNAQLASTSMFLDWHDKLTSVARDLHVSPSGDTFALNHLGFTRVETAESEVLFSQEARLGSGSFFDVSGFAEGEILAVSDHYLLTVEKVTDAPANVGPDSLFENEKKVATVGIVSLDGKATTRHFKGHKESALFAEFDLDGRHVITCGQDRIAILWDSETGQEKAILDAHNAAVCHAAFSRDGKTIITAGIDGAVISWDRTGKKLKSIQLHDYVPDRVSRYYSEMMAEIGKNRFSSVFWPLDIIRGLDVSANGRWVLATILPGENSAFESKSCHYLLDMATGRTIAIRHKGYNVSVRAFFYGDELDLIRFFSVTQQRVRGEYVSEYELNTYSLKEGTFSEN